jgi:aspartyl-tRNA(Asn)/glutamyl-tRNA(Gln) amidotransferase subunit A
MVELAGGMGYRQPNASLTGPGLNPWNAETWSGGSSSGSGSAVAAGLVPFAIGTETWGSITCPCSFCGITGLRPTYGRVPLAGAMALAWTHDKIGPMARTAHDCGVILNALTGPDPDDLSSSDRPYRYPPPDEPGRPFRLAVLKDGANDCLPDVQEHFARALEVFKRQGATIEEITVPDLPFELVASTIISAEGGAAFEEMVESGQVANLTAPEDRTGGYADQVILATEYLRAQRIRAKLARELDRWFARYDAVLTPGEADAAPPAEGRFPHKYNRKSLGGPGNVCGTPAVVMPMGLTRENMPTALQLDGRAYSENRLLAVALAFQRETAHHQAHPPNA